MTQKQSKQSMQQTQDPRATVIQNVAQDQYLLEQVLRDIPSIQHITFDLLVQLFDKCSEIRQEPQFIQAIFNKNTIYEELVLWILQPLKMIQKRQKNEATLPAGDWKRKYPYTCMKIAEKNSSFYISLYLKAYFDQSALMIWFQFLKEPNPQTLNTSLGYFTQIMLPFIKYEFSDSTKICETLSESCDEDFLVSSSVIVREQTSVGKQRQLISNEKKRSFLEEQISILKIFSSDMIQLIYEYIEYESIFKFLHNLILVSLQENDLKRSKSIFQGFLKKTLQTPMDLIEGVIRRSRIQKGPLMDTCNEYVLEVLNEINENANTQKNYRVIFFVDSLIRVHLIDVFIQRIQNSILTAKQNNEQKMSSSVDFTFLTAEEEIIEYYLKSLTVLVKIYSKMVKNRKTEQQIERQSKYYSEQTNQVQNNGQSKVMKQFSQQINQIFIKLPELSMLVKKNLSRVLAFSSGQNIKPITLCKYQFFQLIYNCLLLSREHPQCFVVDTEKINLFSIVEKYLKQNRWNNLAHQILQKIACLLIKNNKNFFRTKQMNKNNMADKFLNSIIQSFTNKKHIFLDSLRFTNQGNLHTLYTIAKAIINELKQSHKLANFVHELQYYKKFVMNDLQEYETNIKENKYPADEEEIRNSQSAEESDEIKLFVDELSVREIVKKIDVVSKWPLKETKRKHGSFIHRSLSYMSDQLLPTHMLISVAQKSKRPLPPSQRSLNTEEEQDNAEETLKPHFFQRLVQTAGPRECTKSQMKGLNKLQASESSFSKVVKRVQSINVNDIPLFKQGKGLFSKSEIKSEDKQQKQLQKSITMTYSPQHQADPYISIHAFRSPTKMCKDLSIEQRFQDSSPQKSSSEKQIKSFSKTQ